MRNRRAAGRATITVRGRKEEVVASELDLEDAARFIREVLAPHARHVRGGEWFVRKLDGIDMDHLEEAAEGRPVFELHALSGGQASAAPERERSRDVTRCSRSWC